MKVIDRAVLGLFILVVAYGVIADDDLIRGACYGMAGLYFLWISVLRMRLSGMGIAIHLLPVSYRVFWDAYFVPWNGWGEIHKATIAVSVTMIAIDLYRDRGKSRGLEKQKPDD